MLTSEQSNTGWGITVTAILCIHCRGDINVYKCKKLQFKKICNSDTAYIT